MKHEMTLIHTMGPNKNVLFQTHLLFVTIYGLMWSSFNDTGPFDSALLLHTLLYLVMFLLYVQQLRSIHKMVLVLFPIISSVLL